MSEKEGQSGPSCITAGGWTRTLSHLFSLHRHPRYGTAGISYIHMRLFVATKFSHHKLISMFINAYSSLNIASLQFHVLTFFASINITFHGKS